MEQPSIARRTAGSIYLVLALMWGVLIAIMATSIGSSKLGGILRGDIDSSHFIFLTLSVYILVSLLLAFLLLAKRSFRPHALKIILGLALLPIVLAPFVATDLFAAIVYLIPYFFTYRFYKEYKPASGAARHLRRVK